MVFTGRKPLSQVRGQRERVGREGAGKGGHTRHRHRPPEVGKVISVEHRVWKEGSTASSRCRQGLCRVRQGGSRRGMNGLQQRGRVQPES